MRANQELDEWEYALHPPALRPRRAGGLAPE